jgi:putative pyruvate formate lyase activating enzyme
VTNRTDSIAAYGALAASGELARRAREAVAALASCRACPRECGTDRGADQTGVCRIGRRARVASYGPHHGEEDCLSGWRGSGTIFFAGCNLRCVFCQNWETSQGCVGEEVTAERLAVMMLELQAAGCHNINWVTPEHVVPQALEALALAAERGLRLPLVYNTSAYDSLESLRLLDGVVDIYMPDFRIWEAATAARLLGARDYPAVACAAIAEMHRQVGSLMVDEQGLASRGVLVRHLVLPGGLADTAAVARWLTENLGADTYVNVMDQYHPAGAVTESAGRTAFADICRGVTRAEFAAAMNDARTGGLRRFDARELRLRRFPSPPLQQ